MSYHLGESQAVELRQLVTLLEDALGKKATLHRLPMQPGDVPVTFADIKKARKLLGYDPQIKIEAGIPQFVQWFRQQP